MKPFYLGLDASKGYADFVILNQSKETVVKPFQIDDTADGHERLTKVLAQFYHTHPKAVLFSAAESTGGYENNWLQTLRALQTRFELKVARVNPLAVKKNSEASLERNKTDRLSARNVAKYLISHPERAFYHEAGGMSSLKNHWTYLDKLVQQRVELYNQLETYLYRAHPELVTYCKDGFPQWVLKLLERYPTAAMVARARPKTLAKIPYLSEERASEIIQAAKSSVASETDAVSARVIQSTAKEILRRTRDIRAEEKAFVGACDQQEEVQLLTTFPGISEFSAVGLLIEMGRVDLFQNVKKLAAYFGVHPVYKESGDDIGAFRMSKAGRKRARRLLFMISLTAIRENPVIKKLYQERVEGGMKKMAAIGVCMHKVLRIIYGMLKSGRPFDSDHEAKRPKPQQQPQAKHPKKERRFQAYDAKAPISRRQHKKRLLEDRSQNDLGVTDGITASAAFEITNDDDIEKFLTIHQPSYDNSAT
jgi:transposase